MKYIKKYEFGPEPKPIWQSGDTYIIGYLDGIKKFKSSTTSSYAILQLIELIGDNSKYINDKKLRKIKVSEADRDHAIKLLTLTDIRLINIPKYRSTDLGKLVKLVGDNIKFKDLPDERYMYYVFKYTPEIISVIKNANIYGDIIDNLIVIRNDFIPDLLIDLAAQNYNL